MKANIRTSFTTAFALLAAASNCFSQVKGGGGLAGPTSQITSPANGAVFQAPVDIPIEASVTPHGSTVAEQTVASAEFFANSNILGFGSLGFCICQWETEQGRPLAPSRLVWSNAPAGQYALTVKATDMNGTSVTSAPVNITIIPSPTPPTNGPTTVSVVATDPTAVVGTNCWTWYSLTNIAQTWSNWFAGNPGLRRMTNCGPKDAVFTVFREGPTNDDLTVNYAVGGTASNGVDYAELFGTVTVPAGQQTAFITVVPLNSASSNFTKYVVVKLRPSTNTPPDYSTTLPTTAVATILDEPALSQPPASWVNGLFQLTAAGPNAAWFHIDYTTNFLNWTPIFTNQVVNGAISFVDPDATNDVRRFYRVVPEPNGP